MTLFSSPECAPLFLMCFFFLFVWVPLVFPLLGTRLVFFPNLRAARPVLGSAVQWLPFSFFLAPAPLKWSKPQKRVPFFSSTEQLSWVIQVFGEASACCPWTTAWRRSTYSPRRWRSSMSEKSQASNGFPCWFFGGMDSV